MIKNMTKFLLTFFFIIITNITFAVDLNENNQSWSIVWNENQQIDYTLNIEKDIDNYIDYEVSINTEYNIDLTELHEKLEILYPKKDFRATWDIIWASSQEGFTFNRNFREKWEKELELNIYEINNLEDDNWNPFTEERILFTKKFQILVYDKIIPIIFSDAISEEELNSYIEYSRQDWIYIYEVWPFNKTDIELTNIVTILNNYSDITWLKVDFIAIWWSRDFIFDVLSKINSEFTTTTNDDIKLNIVSISSYNINILESYLRNFLSNKKWINKLILVNENSKFFILKYESIEELIKELWDNKFDFIDISIPNSWISNFFFISKFINNLSNLWYSTDTIYIFLLIPILFTIVSFFKHFIWISPIWLVIPVFLVELFFKLWIIETIVLLFVFTWINLLLSIFLDRHNLLYTPKISLVLAINVILFVLFFNIWYSYSIINLNLNDVIYFIMFIIISERFINIMLSKDIWEYKTPFFYTILIWLFCYAILNLSPIRIFLLSFPELLLLLIPLNFIIWKFTWLRVTEYFRFREVIKNIEE